MKDFLLFVANIFEVDVKELDEDTSYGQYEKWDSMMHLRLIMEVEEEYGVEIPIDEAPDIHSLRDLYQYTIKG